LPLLSLLLPCVFHLLPERVIFFLNLRINKYFGRNGFFRHRINTNHYFFGRKMTAFEQDRINKAIHHEMRNCSYNARIVPNQNILAIYISQKNKFSRQGERMHR